MTEGTSTRARILCVDDEPRVLEGLRHTLHRLYDVSVAASAAQGEAIIASQGPFAVVMSDLRMPVTDGVTFLTSVRKTAPDTVRVLLTGNADLQAAVVAVNEGNIFRFLNKPCPPELLRSTLEAAVRQYQLVSAERELLEKTLRGAVRVLTEILGIINPAAFGRAQRLQGYVRHVARELELPDVWQLEIAALLSQLGCVSLAPETLDKVYAGQPLSQAEQAAYVKHPVLGHDLLAGIPRLELVAQIIQVQNESALELARRALPPRVIQGALILGLGLTFDKLLAAGMNVDDALNELDRTVEPERKRLLRALSTFQVAEPTTTVRSVSHAELTSGMVLEQDVKAKSGVLLLARGQTVTPAMIIRLRSIAAGVGVLEPIVVRVPAPG